RGVLTVSDSTLSQNSARGGFDFPFGGGIFNAGALAIRGSTLSGNGTSSDRVASGGGIFNEGILTVSNSTLSGNTAQGGLGDLGGGIANQGTLSLANSTIGGNEATFGGGIDNVGAVEMRNTILAGNGGEFSECPDLCGHVNSLGHNLIGTTYGGSGYNDTDLLNVDPLLGPLQDNGRPTHTTAPAPGSRAIDAGDNTDAPPWDQRGPGFPRIVNGVIDIGAFEVQEGGALRSGTGGRKQTLLDPLSAHVAAFPSLA